MKLDPRTGDGRPVSPALYRALVHSWTCAIGLLSIVASVLFFVLPPDLLGDPVVASQLKDFAGVYYVIYGVAGGCMLSGALARKPSLEALGLSLLASAVSIALVCLFAVIGLKAAVSAPGTAALMFGALGRVLVVSQIVRPRRDGEET